ncbi:DUF4870 domain-containing protein [Oscillatoriales cyanobacterium LEGE 11467]|uniref:DUF4870 domain-containing protein n=1 Tax=Zarconia navalis LEGE 11467 TaxID=1828826 RepID=A0A928VSE5_9CYAN|nr:DUF4870 domain-containing protein [Zarconia navalis]MBE9039529.1 DUF4870 domain-containing protein [Zarconia navalis LEGE 11467]
MYDEDKRKLLSALCHGSIFISAAVLAIGIPIGILFISDDPVVKDNAKESLNFHINLWIYGVIFGILCLVGIGFILLGILFLVSWIMPIIAIVRVLANPATTYRYPFIFRLV